MRRVRITTLLFLTALLLGPTPADAQTSQDPLTEGILAFREGRYEEAVRSFEQATEDEATRAEAHFLLARIFFETPLQNVGRAGTELDQALELEPGNVQFMVARMQQLRAETWNFFSERVREQRRVELARKILAIDSTNAFAHEELGALHIRDFWRYRNALMLPTLLFRENEYRTPSAVDPLVSRLQEQLDQIRSDPQLGGDVFYQNEWEELQADADFGPFSQNINPSSVFMADQFDVDALMLQGVPVVDLSGRAQRAYDLAIGHLDAALRTDPRHRTIYGYLMEIYSLKGEWANALEMLQQMYVFFPDDPDLWTYLGLAHYRAGNLDAAAKAFESSFQFMAESDRVAYNDLSDLVPEEEKGTYREDPAGFTARYWTSKDPRFLTPYNERKIEHYARVTYTELLYSAPNVDLRGWDTERGRILIRYGLPLSDVIIIPRSTSGIDRPAGESVPGMDDRQGLVSGSLDVLREGSNFDMFGEANTYNIWDYGDFKFVFEDPFRNGEYRMYSPPASAISAGAQPWINDYVIKARETFREIPDRFEYEAPGRQIDVPFLLSSFRGDGGSTDLVVNYAIPINEFLEPGEIINVTANAGLFVVGADREILAERRRTLYGLRTDQIVQFQEANLWVDSEQLTVPPGEVEVSVEFETTSGATVGVQRRTATLTDYSGDELSISDVLLSYRIEEADNGRPVSGADIVRHGLSIMPAPWSVFSHDQPVYIYFEVYNLTREANGMARYEVEAALVPKEKGSGVGRFIRGIFGGGAGGVSVGVPFSIASDEDGQYLILDASNQEPGLYTLDLKIKDLSNGREVQRTQDLFLE